MKFGFDIECDQNFATAVQQAVRAEELGYDSLFIAEHHNSIGYLPQPLMALSALATRTSHIQLGSNIVILPLYHPVVVAEQAAMTQHISQGRLLLGVGLGYLPDEFASFGVPFGERAGRMEESLQLLRRLWAEKDVEHTGKYYQFSHATIHPRLDTIGTPPIWVGGWADAAVRRAARLGDAWVPGPTVNFDTLRQCYEVFNEELGRTNKPPAQDYPATRELYCAPTHEAAVSIGGAAMYKFYKDTYLQWPHPRLRAEERAMSYEDLARDRFIIGDPDECIEAVSKLQAMGITQLSFRMQIPGLRPEDVATSMELFMDRVVPSFR